MMNPEREELLGWSTFNFFPNCFASKTTESLAHKEHFSAQARANNVDQWHPCLVGWFWLVGLGQDDSPVLNILKSMPNLEELNLSNLKLRLEDLNLFWESDFVLTMLKTFHVSTVIGELTQNELEATFVSFLSNLKIWIKCKSGQIAEMPETFCGHVKQ
jgi:hypothetical protein